MRVWEEVPVADAALPVQEMKDHLRLGSGFSDDGMQDALTRGYLRAALAAIEGRIGKALLARRFNLELPGWRDPGMQALPLAPVSEVVSVTVIGAGGEAVVVPVSRWWLEVDPHRPKLVAKTVSFPAVPSGGVARVVFDAGFGPWAGVPPDLRQAVLLLAAQFHEFRFDAAGKDGAMPFGVMALIERWRSVRVLGGGR